MEDAVKDPQDGETLPSPVDIDVEPKTNPPIAGQDIQTAVSTFTDRLLLFLGSASNETLGACVVGLGAATYLILGRVGLLLIGAFGGIILHATWEGKSQADDAQGTETKRRRELGLDVAQRVLAWRSNRLRREDDNEDEQPADQFSDFGSEVGKALNVLTDAVIRDYVRWWYSPQLPSEESFPAVSRRTFSTFLLSLSNNISRKRPADTFVEFVTNSSSIFIVFLNELSTALFASPSSDPEDAIQTYLESKPDSSLSTMLHPDQQSQKLLGVADDILYTYLDPKVYACPPADVFLRQILAQLVLGMTLDRCSQADWINEWIVYLLEEGEPELLTAIDVGVESSSAIANSSTVDPDQESVKTEHKRTKSKAEDAMDEAMLEAQRLTQMIVAEEAKRQSEDGSHQSTIDDASDSTNTHGVQTPTSSQDDDTLLNGEVADAVPKASLEVEAPTTSFTSFDQLGGQGIPTALLDDDTPIRYRRQENMTLHKARISIFDDAQPGDKKAIRSKPETEYMVQIEPASDDFSGWMIARTYEDVETLHEVLKRISTITGTVSFTEAHAQLPSWRGRTKAQLTQDLERYLMDALNLEPLAESEGMKRFLEKERNMPIKSPKNKGGLWAGPAAIENMGKGVFDVLSKAPKNVAGGVAGGGKAVFGGVTSVFGAMSGQPSRSVTAPVSSNSGRRNPSSTSIDPSNTLHQITPSTSSTLNSQTRQSLESPRIPAESSPQPQSRPSSTFGRSRASLEIDTDNDKALPMPPTEVGSPSPSTPHEPQMDLPPPPSAMPDDFMFPRKEDTDASNTSAAPAPNNGTPNKPAPARRKPKAPLSEKEAQVTIELLFAVINELYTLSSAWTLRRQLLNAARTYLLRPGNPQLESIRALLQESILDANSSDAGIAAHILKLRENGLPTEEELAKWPKPRSDEEKEKLRVKARKLLVAKGMPQALTSVMGQAASGEALGKVFDCLQVQKVARGLMFGLMLQAVRALTQ